MTGAGRLREGLVGLALAAGSTAAALAAPTPSHGDAGLAAAPAPTIEQTTTLARTSAPPIGPTWDDDAALPAHADDVVDYTLHATLDPALHTVRGSGTIVWRNRSVVPVRELWLHLYLNAFKNERSVFLREPVGFGRGGGGVSEFGYIDVKSLVARELDGADLLRGAERTSPGDPDDETDVRVPLPREVEPGATLTLDVAWESRLPSLVERTGHAGTFYLVGQWFPKLARLERDGRWAHFPFHHLAEFYADFGAYDVTLDVPAGYVVGATGTSTAPEAPAPTGRSVTRWVQRDVHDFAWTAWDHFEQHAADVDGVAVRVLAPPGYGAAVAREIETVRFGLRRFGERFGRYPYPVLTVVHPPDGADEAGGMEYPTLITTGGAWWEPRSLRRIEAVTLHELGHQWFYGLVASDELTHPFLDEGLNSYAEQVALTEWLGPGTLASLPGLELGDAELRRAAAVAVGHDDPVAQPASAFVTGRDYGGLVYARTATIFATLAGTYGQAPVMRALGRYARRFRWEHPTPADLVGAVREVVGEEAAANLEAALFDRAWVDYVAVAATSRRRTTAAGLFDRAGKRETATATKSADGGFEGWALIQRHGTLSLPVDIELRGRDGSVERVRWDGRGRSTRVTWTGPSELATAVVDPDARVLLDEDRTNDAVRAAGHAPASRAFEHALYLAEVGLAAAMP